MDSCLIASNSHSIDKAASTSPDEHRTRKQGSRATGGDVIHSEAVQRRCQIDEYDDNITRRVQRLFDGIQVGRPLVRFNALRYRDASLFQPRREGDRRPRPLGDVEYVRSERQCLFRLPRTDAVVFAIHTTVLRHAGLGGASQQALKAYMTH